MRFGPWALLPLILALAPGAAPLAGQRVAGGTMSECAPVVAGTGAAGLQAAGIQEGVPPCLTLAEAEALALEGNRDLAASRSRARAAEARSAQAEAFLYPSVGVEAGMIRSDDPVAAFGARLRQGRFTEADFAPDRLNHPDATEDWTAGLGVRWTALDPGRWAGRKAADRGARAASLEAERTGEAVVYQTRMLYLEAVRTTARLEAALQAEAAADANATLLRRRGEEGMLTDADVLQGVAALAESRAHVVEAERQAEDARLRLTLHLGLDPRAPVIPVEGEGALDAVAAGVEGGEGAATGGALARGLADRPDLRASEAGLGAVRAQVDRARMARLPTVEAFGQWATHAPGAFDGREGDLTLGLQLRLPLFTGFQIGSAVDEAEALASAAASEHEARLDEAVAQVEEARRAVLASVRGVEAARAAAEASEEAARLMRRRFQEGLATTAELLQAEARASTLRAGAVDARARAAMARATLDFVNPPSSTPVVHSR